MVHRVPNGRREFGEGIFPLLCGVFTQEACVVGLDRSKEEKGHEVSIAVNQGLMKNQVDCHDGKDVIRYSLNDLSY